MQIDESLNEDGNESVSSSEVQDPISEGDGA